MTQNCLGGFRPLAWKLLLSSTTQHCLQAQLTFASLKSYDSKQKRETSWSAVAVPSGRFRLLNPGQVFVRLTDLS